MLTTNTLAQHAALHASTDVIEGVASTCTGHARTALTVAIIGTLILRAPIAAAVIVMTWHGLRGTKPGPAGTQLLKLVELVLTRPRSRHRRPSCRPADNSQTGPAEDASLHSRRHPGRAAGRVKRGPPPQT